MKDLNTFQTSRGILMILQSLQKLFLNIIESVGEQFFTRFSKFRELEETEKFTKFPDSIKMEELNLQKFSWIVMDEFEMQLIESQSSSSWKRRFVDLRVDLENIEKKRLEKGILERSAEKRTIADLECHSWKVFRAVKNFATALLFMFSFTYACESLLSVMNFIKSSNRSSLTDETSSSCISLKVTNYKPNVKSLSAVMQQQTSHWYSTRKVIKALSDWCFLWN